MGVSSEGLPERQCFALNSWSGCQTKGIVSVYKTLFRNVHPHQIRDQTEGIVIEPTDLFLRGLTIWDQASSGCFRENIRYDSLWAEERRWHLPWMPSQELATNTAVAILSASRWSSVKVQGSLSSLLRFAVITSSNLPHLRDVVAYFHPFLLPISITSQSASLPQFTVSSSCHHQIYKISLTDKKYLSAIIASNLPHLSGWYNFSPQVLYSAILPITHCIPPYMSSPLIEGHYP